MTPVLFTFGWEKTMTAGGIFKKAAGGPWFLPFELAFDVVSRRPDSSFTEALTKREVCIAMCLIDCRTGEVLWSDIELAHGLLKLEHPETTSKLVGRARGKFHKFVTNLF